MNALGTNPVFAQRGTAPARPPARVLFADDEPALRDYTTDILTSLGYEVTAVASGMEALDRIRATPPDIIVSDVRMPGLNGFQLLQLVREHPAWTLIPFIIVSGLSETADIRMGMSLGADDYLTKPFRLDDLRRTLEARLARARRLGDVMAHHQWFLTHTLPHELRTPLTGVIGHADMMVDAANEGRGLSLDELREYGQVLQRAGSSMLSIVRNFLFWARLEEAATPRTSGARPPEQEVLTGVELEPLAQEVADRYERGLDLNCSRIMDAAVQVATPGSLFIVRHLLDNAFKYSLPGSKVTLSAFVNNGAYSIVVMDTGRGMSADQIARVGLLRQFDRQQYEQQGLGMGLTLARRFVRLSGGSLDLQPGADRCGLIVTMTLPLAEMSGEAESAPPPA